MQSQPRSHGPHPAAGSHRAARLALALVPLAVFLLAAWGGRAPASPIAGARNAALQPGWNPITPGAGTACIDGSSFVFYVRRGATDRLAIVFAGGGACWNSATCDTCVSPGYRVRAMTQGALEASGGLLDFSTGTNPIRDYTCVFVPFCTGDVNLGAREASYETPPRGCVSGPLVIRHYGATNARAVMDWVFEHVPDPRTVCVVGHSAGAIASPLYAAIAARHWPRARVVQLGDAAGAYHPLLIQALIPAWGADKVLHTAWGAPVSDTTVWTCEQIYLTAARLAPGVAYTQVNMAQDAEQQRYLSLGGVPDSVTRVLAGNLALLHRGIPGFRSFTGPGSAHVVTTRPEFYSLKVGGVRLREWVTRRIQGRAVADVGAELLDAAAVAAPR